MLDFKKLLVMVGLGLVMGSNSLVCEPVGDFGTAQSRFEFSRYPQPQGPWKYYAVKEDNSVPEYTYYGGEVYPTTFPEEFNLDRTPAEQAEAREATLAQKNADSIAQGAKAEETQRQRRSLYMNEEPQAPQRRQSQRTQAPKFQQKRPRTLQSTRDPVK